MCNLYLVCAQLARRRGPTLRRLSDRIQQHIEAVSRRTNTRTRTDTRNSRNTRRSATQNTSCTFRNHAKYSLSHAKDELEEDPDSRTAGIGIFPSFRRSLPSCPVFILPRVRHRPCHRICSSSTSTEYSLEHRLRPSGPPARYVSRDSPSRTNEETVRPR